MQKDCIFLVKFCSRKGPLLHKAETQQAHKHMKALERSNGGSKEKVAKPDKSMLFGELKATLKCYILAFKTLAVKCISCFSLR